MAQWLRHLAPESQVSQPQWMIFVGRWNAKHLCAKALAHIKEPPEVEMNVKHSTTICLKTHNVALACKIDYNKQVQAQNWIPANPWGKHTDCVRYSMNQDTPSGLTWEQTAFSISKYTTVICRMLFCWLRNTLSNKSCLPRTCGILSANLVMLYNNTFLQLWGKKSK